jgi:hypothetical protein
VLYVYGVIRSGTSGGPAIEGVGDAAVTLLEEGDLTAAVSALPEGPLQARRRDLLRHLDVIQKLFGETTVVPSAFGTVVESPETLRQEVLLGRRHELLDLLKRLGGRVQMTVKASHNEEELLREIVAAEPEIARLREQTQGRGHAAYYDNIRLGELVAGALAVRRETDAARVLDRLAVEADDVVVDGTAGDDFVLKAFFLVDERRLSRFDAALERLAREEAPRLFFNCVGPVPPTAFVSTWGS